MAQDAGLKWDFHDVSLRDKSEGDLSVICEVSLSPGGTMMNHEQLLGAFALGVLAWSGSSCLVWRLRSQGLYAVLSLYFSK